MTGPLYLAVPTQKGPHDPPVDLDHFLVYNVLEYSGPPLEVGLWLKDQFTDQFATVYQPVFFANPVQKTHAHAVTDIKNPDDHLVLYYIDSEEFVAELPIANQFGPRTFMYTRMLCIMVSSACRR